MTIKRILAMVLISLLPLTGLAQAPDAEFNFQGRLISPNGSPVTGSASADISIYRTTGYGTSTGTKVWEQTKNLVFTNGFFSIVISDLNSAIGGGHVFDTSENYYEIEIKIGTHQYPRIPIRPTPQSINALRFQGHSLADFLLKSDFSSTGQLIVGSPSGATALGPGSLNQYLVMGPGGPQWSHILPPRTAAETKFVLATNGTSSDGNDLYWRQLELLPESTITDAGKILMVGSSGAAEWKAVDPSSSQNHSTLLTRVGNDIKSFTSGPADTTLVADTNGTFSWRKLNIASLEDPGTSEANKVLSVAADGKPQWRTISELPATPDPTNPSNNNEVFLLTWDTTDSPAELKWVKDDRSPVYFHATSNQTLQNAGYYYPNWTAGISSNHISTHTNGVIQLPSTRPGVYRVTISITIAEGNATARLFKVMTNTNNSTSSGTMETHASIRYKPGPFPYHGSTESVTFLLNVVSGQDRYLFIQADYPIRVGNAEDQYGNTTVIERISTP